MLQKQSARSLDRNGFMMAKGCKLSREGVYQYSAGQCKLPGDPNRIVNVFRPGFEVADEESVESLRLLPLIVEHTMMSGLDSQVGNLAAAEDVGVDGVLGSNIYFDESDGWLKGDIKVFSRKVLKLIGDGEDSLSLGFGCKFIPKQGEYKGQKYEVVQTRIRGNHLALVGEARVDGAQVADSFCFDSLNFDLVEPTGEEESMNPEQLKQLIALLPKLKAILGLGTEATAEAAPAAEAAEPAAEAVPAEASAEPVAEAAATEPGEQEVVDADGEAQAAEAAAVEAAEPAAEAAPAESAPAAEAVATEASDVEKDKVALGSQIDALIAQLSDLCAHGAAAGATDSNGEAQLTNAEDNAEEESHAMDSKAMMKNFRQDEQLKAELYARSSELVGAFDHQAMDSAEMAGYVAKKLNIKAAKGNEINAVSMFLDGVDRAKQSQATMVGDSASLVSKQNKAQAESAVGAFLDSRS